MDPCHVIEAFDWSSITDGTVVDIGGSNGATMAALSERYPSLHCIVQDLSSTVARRPPLSLHRKDGVSFMAHDFFHEQPCKQADVYFFRLVLHDWSDEHATQILRALIPALKPGCHILLNEWCLPEPNTVSLLEERRLR